jgi:hypothetical protein
METILRVSKKFILGTCACGCRQTIEVRNKMLKLRRFVNGHNRRLVDHGRICADCGRNDADHWYNHGDWYCKTCNDKRFINPGLLYFKNRQVRLKESVRKGQCQKCGKKIGDSYIDCEGLKAAVKLTHIHHREYHDEDPLKDTIELCVSCHIKESWDLGSYESLRTPNKP